MILTREGEPETETAINALNLEAELSFCRVYGLEFSETDLMLKCMPYNGRPVLYFRKKFEKPSIARSRALAILLVCYRSFCSQAYKPLHALEVSVYRGQIVYCELQLDSLAVEALQAMGVAIPEYSPPEAATAQPVACTALATT